MTLNAEVFEIERIPGDRYKKKKCLQIIRKDSKIMIFKYCPTKHLNHEPLLIENFENHGKFEKLYSQKNIVETVSMSNMFFVLVQNRSF
jgi:hypothetical protein